MFEHHLRHPRASPKLHLIKGLRNLLRLRIGLHVIKNTRRRVVRCLRYSYALVARSPVLHELSESPGIHRQMTDSYTKNRPTVQMGYPNMKQRRFTPSLVVHIWHDTIQTPLFHQLWYILDISRSLDNFHDHTLIVQRQLRILRIRYDPSRQGRIHGKHLSERPLEVVRVELLGENIRHVQVCKCQHGTTKRGSGPCTFWAARGSNCSCFSHGSSTKTLGGSWSKKIPKA
mmetsp:Transcript_4919/g.10921  ORF Transcript_4919/g.10921 Transcript_4919/m.10921 type:complete len:230 (-) Transcript_4919:4-693(-)